LCGGESYYSDEAHHYSDGAYHYSDGTLLWTVFSLLFPDFLNFFSFVPPFPAVRRGLGIENLSVLKNPPETLASFGRILGKDYRC
jgi:hypothetical protein